MTSNIASSSKKSWFINIAIYFKANNDEIIEPILAKTLLMFAKAILYSGCKASIVMYKLKYAGKSYNFKLVKKLVLYDYWNISDMKLYYLYSGKIIPVFVVAFVYYKYKLLIKVKSSFKYT